MQENEIEEFCETSSWETSSDQEDYYDLIAPDKNVGKAKR